MESELAYVRRKFVEPRSEDTYSEQNVEGGTKKCLPAVEPPAAPYDILNSKCPTQQVLDRIASKWTMLVLLTLGEETLRYSDLRRRLPDVTQKMLTQTVRALERDGLLHRRADDSVPVKTEYALTQLGQSLARAVAVIRDWAYTNMEDIALSRSRFDGTRRNPNRRGLT
jgi:DNA-binding HxlR family transcriptional regulator